MAIGRAGARNAALFAARILSLSDDRVRQAVAGHVLRQQAAVLDDPDPREEPPT